MPEGDARSIEIDVTDKARVRGRQNRHTFFEELTAQQVMVSNPNDKFCGESEAKVSGRKVNLNGAAIQKEAKFRLGPVVR